MKHLLLPLLATLASPLCAQTQETATTVMANTPSNTSTQTGAAQTATTQMGIAQTATTMAATLRFGFLSYQTAMKAMPEYAESQRSLDGLRAKYDSEMKRVEDEFNAKYEAFLDGQSSFAPSIRQKRQAELQELMEKNQAFKAEARRLLAEAEQQALKPVRDKLDAAIRKVGADKGLAFVVNTDGNALPFVNPNMGVDVTADVAAALR